jgi:septal ring factor EnvC (AmiA/AmiB activator)
MGPKTAGKRVKRHGMVYYRCYREGEIEPCPVHGGYLEAAFLEAHIETELLNRINSDAFRDSLAELLKEREKDETTLFRSELQRMEQELQKLEKELAFVDKQFRREEITIAEARRLRAGVEAEMAELTASQEKIQAQLAQGDQTKTGHSLLLVQLDMAARWEMLNTLEKKEVLSNFVERIEGYRPKAAAEAEVTIVWRFGEASEVRVAQPTRRRNA